MTKYEYRVVPAPRKGIRVKGIKGEDGRFAAALTALMNEMGAQGWAYLRSDTLPSEARHGLRSKTVTSQNMLVFQRPLQETPDTAVVFDAEPARVREPAMPARTAEPAITARTAEPAITDKAPAADPQAASAPQAPDEALASVQTKVPTLAAIAANKADTSAAPRLGSAGDKKDAAGTKTGPTPKITPERKPR